MKYKAHDISIYAYQWLGSHESYLSIERHLRPNVKPLWNREEGTLLIADERRGTHIRVSLGDFIVQQGSSIYGIDSGLFFALFEEDK